MSDLITTGIDQLAASPGPGHGWTVRFRSVHAGLHHQLYANGRLVAWSEMPQQRCFFVDEPAAPVAMMIAAVPSSLRATDLTDQLPPEGRTFRWIYRIRAARTRPIRSGDVVEILTDHASGTVDPAPLAQVEVWPAHVPRWAFGQDRFAAGGFGYDGANGPGLGRAAFAVGPFGIDGDLMDLQVALAEEGIHQIILRTRGSDGQTTDSDPIPVDVILPPAEPKSLTALGYVPLTRHLTLQIN